MIRIAPLLLVGMFACSNKDDDDDSSQPKDSGANDSGNMTPDGGVADSGENPDTGVVGACNPFDGTGCPNADEYCVYVVQQNMASCRTLPAMNGNEMACSPTLNDCAPGYACADLGGGPICRHVCDLQNDQQCGSVTGMFTDYVCTGFTIQGQNSIYGLCEGQNLCNPAEKAAACMAGETCSLVSQQGDTGCVAAGNAAIGATCSAQDNCMSGGICLNVGNGLTCYEACDQQNPCTMPTDRCQGLQNIPWGICIAMGTACDPIMMPCQAGMTCSLLTGNPECTASGTAAVGDPCGPNMQCVDNAVCVFLQGQANPQCYEPCDLQNANCSAGQCGNIGAAFGICN